METLAARLKGLSDTTRLRILNLLSDGELCVCDLMAVLNIPQSTISRHLAYLRNSGWVEGRRKGRWMYYRRPHHPTTFQARIFSLLGEEFSTLPQIKRDAEALVHQLANKKRDCKEGAKS